MGSVADDMCQALDERRDLITQRADAVLGKAIADDAQWISQLGPPPEGTALRDTWRRSARTVAAYRDRYKIKTASVLGPRPEDTAQRIDRARAEAALNEVCRNAEHERAAHAHREATARRSTGRTM